MTKKEENSETMRMIGGIFSTANRPAKTFISSECNGKHHIF